MKNFYLTHLFNFLILVSQLFLYQHAASAGQVSVNKFNDDTSQLNINSTTFLQRNPSLWIQKSLNKINKVRIELSEVPDSTSLFEQLNEISNSNEMIRKNLDYNAHAFKIRQVTDLKAELDVELKEIARLQKKQLRISSHLLQKAGTIEGIRQEIIIFGVGYDTSFTNTYLSEIKLLQDELEDANNELKFWLRKEILKENAINKVFSSLSQTNNYANSLLLDMRKRLTKPDLPAVWNAAPDKYTHTFVQSITETFNHIKDSVSFFMEHNITGFVIYRILIFLLCLLPVHYFRRRQGQHLPAHYQQKFLQTYPTLASVVMGFAAIPLIFEHAPYAFLDFILISLTISVGIIFLKEHKYLSRPAFYTLLASYILLKVIHFFSSPTFSGRLIFTASIVLIVPMFLILKDIEKYAKHRHFAARTAYILLLLQMSLGWLLMVFGYYPQGRQLFLGAFDAFVLAVILYVTVYTLIDYLRLAAWLINSKIQSFSLNHPFIESRFRNWLMFFAFLFFITSYLKSIFVYKPLLNLITGFNTQNLPTDTEHTNLAGILPALATLVFSIYLSYFLKHSLLNVTNSGKTNYTMNQYVLIARIALVSAGIIAGILISGISFTSFTLPVLALSFGLGWALKDLLSNLIAGLVITFTHRFNAGDLISYNDSIGKIQSIGSTLTVLRSNDDKQFVIPNQLFLSGKMTIISETED